MVKIVSSVNEDDCKISISGIAPEIVYEIYTITQAIKDFSEEHFGKGSFEKIIKELK